MLVETYIASGELIFESRHSQFPNLKLGKNSRFDILFNGEKVIGNIDECELDIMMVGEHCAAQISARWIGGIEKEFLTKDSIQIVVLNEVLGTFKVNDSELLSSMEA